MFGKLFIVFAVLPILEIMVLLNVSDSIGGWNTFLLVIVTAFFGAYFVRREGINTLASVQLKMAQGEMPGKEMSEGLLLLVAGVLLVTPGFITDIFGLIFTLPVTRAPIARFIVSSFVKSKHANVNFSAGGFGQAGNPFNTGSNSAASNKTSTGFEQGGEVIDGEYTERRSDAVSLETKVEPSSHNDKN